MQRLYTESLAYGLERQRQLQGERRRELPSLSDGHRLTVSQWLDRATEWVADQLEYLGKHVQCLEDELACGLA